MMANGEPPPAECDRPADQSCPHGLCRQAALCAVMRYRIDMSQSRKGFARIDFPGRILALEANRRVGPVWLVGISDLAGEAPGEAPGEAGRSVAVRAGSAGEAVWRVARTAARATW